VMAVIEDCREVADTVASMFRNGNDRWGDLSRAFLWTAEWSVDCSIEFPIVLLAFPLQL